MLFYIAKKDAKRLSIDIDLLTSVTLDKVRQVMEKINKLNYRLNKIIFQDS